MRSQRIEQVKYRVEQALEETQRYIDKESARADDLRPANIQALLERYIAHKVTLTRMLGKLGNK